MAYNRRNRPPPTLLPPRGFGPSRVQRLERIEKKIDENEERALTRFATLSQKVVQIDERVDDLQAKVSYIDERTERTEKKVTQNNRRLEKLGEIGRRATAADFARSG